MAQKIEGVPEGVTLSPVNQVQGVPPGVTLTPINKGSDTMGAAPPAGIARPELKPLSRPHSLTEPFWGAPTTVDAPQSKPTTPPLGLWDSLRERVMGDTEPTPFNTDTTPKDTSLGENLRTMGNAAGNAFIKEPLNIAKRAGRTAFSMADAPVQGAAHVVKGLLGNEQEADKALGGGPGHLRDYLSPLDYLPTTQVINRGIEFGKEALNHPFGDDGSGNSGLGTALTNASGDLLGMELGGKALDHAVSSVPHVAKATGEAGKWAGNKMQDAGAGLMNKTVGMRKGDFGLSGKGANPGRSYLEGVDRNLTTDENGKVVPLRSGLGWLNPANHGIGGMRTLANTSEGVKNATGSEIGRTIGEASRRYTGQHLEYDDVTGEAMRVPDALNPAYSDIPGADVRAAIYNPFNRAREVVGGEFGGGTSALDARAATFDGLLNTRSTGRSRISFPGIEDSPHDSSGATYPDNPIIIPGEVSSVPKHTLTPEEVWGAKHNVAQNVGWNDPNQVGLTSVGHEIAGKLGDLLEKHVPSLGEKDNPVGDSGLNKVYSGLVPFSQRALERANTGSMPLSTLFRRAGMEGLGGAALGMHTGGPLGALGGFVGGAALESPSVASAASKGLWNAGSLLGKGGGALSDFAGDMPVRHGLSDLVKGEEGFNWPEGYKPRPNGFLKRLFNQDKGEFTFGTGAEPPSAEDFKNPLEPENLNQVKRPGYTVSRGGDFVPPPIDVQGKPMPDTTKPFSAEKYHATGEGNEPVETPKTDVTPAKTPSPADEWQRALQEFRAKEAPKPAAKSSFLKRLLGEDRGEFGIGGDEPPTFGAKDKLEPHELTPLDTHFFDKNTGFGQEGQPFNIKGDVIPFKKGGDVSDRGADLIRNLTQHPEDEPEKGNLIPLNSFKGNFNALGDPDKAFKLHDPNNLPEPLMMPKRLADASKPDLSGLRGMANSPEVQERLSKMKPKDEPEPPTPPKGVKAKILNFIRDESGNLKIPDYIQESLRLKDTKSLRVAQEDLSAAANQVDNEIQQAFEAGDKEKLDHLNTLREWLEYVHSKVTGAIGTPPPPKPSNRLIEPAKSQQRSETMQKSWNSRKGIK